MDKKKLTDRTFKVLPLYESSSKVDFEKYLSKTINTFSGLEETEALDLIISQLRGLKKIHEELTHDEVKSIVFDMISTIKKNY